MAGDTMKQDIHMMLGQCRNLNDIAGGLQKLKEACDLVGLVELSRELQAYRQGVQANAEAIASGIRLYLK